MNVPWVCYTCHALLYGGVGLAYRAWNSVVFLLYSGIAKPLSSVKNERTSRFFACKIVPLWLRTSRFFVYILKIYDF